jgi:hypothetical protein
MHVALIPKFCPVPAHPRHFLDALQNVRSGGPAAPGPSSTPQQIAEGTLAGPTADQSGVVAPNAEDPAAGSGATIHQGKAVLRAGARARARRPFSNASH